MRQKTLNLWMVPTFIYYLHFNFFFKSWTPWKKKQNFRILVLHRNELTTPSVFLFLCQRYLTLKVLYTPTPCVWFHLNHMDIFIIGKYKAKRMAIPKLSRIANRWIGHLRVRRTHWYINRLIRQSRIGMVIKSSGIWSNCHWFRSPKKH